MNNATQENDSADKEWIRKTSAELGADSEPIIELCAAFGATVVRAALHDAARDAAKIKSVLGFVRWRAARLHEAAERQRATDRRRSERIASDALQRADAARTAAQDEARSIADFEAIPAGDLGQLFDRALSGVEEPLRSRLRDRGPRGGLIIRGMILDIARKLGYKFPRSHPSEPAASGSPPPGAPS